MNANPPKLSVLPGGVPKKSCPHRGRPTLPVGCEKCSNTNAKIAVQRIREGRFVPYLAWDRATGYLALV